MVCWPHPQHPLSSLACCLQRMCIALGVLADVLRNYLMQNTSAVFEKSYQAEHIRANPLRLRFMPLYSDEEEWHSEDLERVMRTMVSRCDPNAPVEPSTEYLQSFGFRRDVSDLRKRIADARAEKNSRREDWRPLYFKYKRLIENLSRQAVEKMRAEYFDRVDRLRALGQSTLEEAASAATTTSSRAKHARLCHGTNALAWVARYIRLHNDMAWDTTKPRGTRYDKTRFLESLLGYLNNQPAVEAVREELEEEPMMWEVTGAAIPSPNEQKHMCLLCGEFFFSLDSLTNHCKNMHVNKGAFDHPFQCPECRRCGNLDDHSITSPSSWSAHVEIFHGNNNAPRLRTDPQPSAYEAKICCPFCGLFVEAERGFNKHRNTHLRDGTASTIFSTPFPCLACRIEQGSDWKQDIMIDGYSAWDAHVALVHADAEGNWFVEGPPQPSGSSEGTNEMYACLLCDDRRSFSSRKGLTAHCKKIHVKVGRKFSKPFPCPECRRLGAPDHSITSASSWSSHAAKSHGWKNTPKLRTVAPQPTLDRTKQHEHLSSAHSDDQENRPVEVSPAASESNDASVCFLCDDRRTFSFKCNLTAHCKAIHVRDGKFEEPFPCPECRRCGKADYMITTPSTWSSHVASVHGPANAPTLRTEPAPARTALCPFCGIVGSGKHRNSHVRGGPVSAIFSNPFPCLACRNDSQQGGVQQDVMINGFSAWNAHVFSAHVKNARAWTVGITPVGIKKRRRREDEENTKRDKVQCLLCDGDFPRQGIRHHFRMTHLPALASGRASCVECGAPQEGEAELTSLITGIDAWNEHVQSAHRDLSWYFTARESIVDEGKRRKIDRAGIDDVLRDDFSDDTPSLEQSSIDLSVMDPTPHDWNDRALRHGTATPESPHTPMPWEGIDINLIDPQLRGEENKESSMEPK
jgi:hypothetical protein